MGLRVVRFLSLLLVAVMWGAGLGHLLALIALILSLPTRDAREIQL